MHADWYAATVATDAPDLTRFLSRWLGAKVLPGQAMNGYDVGLQLVVGTEVVARLLHGGNGGRPHVMASGERAEPLRKALRAGYPKAHSVTRIDAAEDFDGPGTWDRLSALALDFADRHRLAIDQNGDWYRAQNGRTLYVGSKTSAVRLLIYEKGKQLRDDGAPGAENVSPDLVRVELRCRPEGEARQHAATCDVPEVYGYAKWSQAFAAEVHGLDVARVALKPVRDSDDRRAVRAMAKQYAGVLSRVAAEAGGFEELWPQLERMVLAELARKADR